MKLRYNSKDVKEFDRKPGAFLAELMTDQNYAPSTRSITPSARTSTPKENNYRHKPQINEIKQDLPKQQNSQEQVITTQNYHPSYNSLPNDKFKSAVL